MKKYPGVWPTNSQNHFPELKLTSEGSCTATFPGELFRTVSPFWENIKFSFGAKYRLYFPTSPLYNCAPWVWGWEIVLLRIKAERNRKAMQCYAKQWRWNKWSWQKMLMLMMNKWWCGCSFFSGWTNKKQTKQKKKNQGNKIMNHSQMKEIWKEGR